MPLAPQPHGRHFLSESHWEKRDLRDRSVSGTQLAASADGARDSRRLCRLGRGSGAERSRYRPREEGSEPGSVGLRTDRPVAFASWRTRERLAGVVRAKPERIGGELGTEPTSRCQNAIFRSVILPTSYARFRTCISPGKEFVTLLRFPEGFLTPQSSKLSHRE